MADDLEHELLLARMRAIQHESQLINQVVKLQRIRIVQLEGALANAQRLLKVSRAPAVGSTCRRCGEMTKNGQTFCSRSCYYQWAGARRQEEAVDKERGTSRLTTVNRERTA